MLTLDAFDYHLPQKMIAQQPVTPRDQSRLLVINRSNQQLAHHHFHELPSLLSPGDVLVRNNTKVIPARIFGHKPTGGKVELVLIKRLTTQPKQETWSCLTKPGLKPGQRVQFENSDLVATCQKVTNYARTISFNQTQTQLMESLDKIGHTPIPPYINWDEADEKELRQLYQTTYAQIKGSAAAPTAGLHFTPELDQQLKQKGVVIAELTLHVGLGTFLPVKMDDISQHQMHGEVFSLTANTATQLNQAKQNGQRIIAVGTTTTRVLESCADQETGLLQAQSGETKLYLYPPAKFHFIEGLITNFHLPKSTLLMLVSAFVSWPNTKTRFISFQQSLLGQAYNQAAVHKYRFYSFGDAMLIW